jgi:hypothetical protein
MLLFTYPREFRQRFKCEMVSTFSDLICGEWEQKSVLGVARVWRSALGGSVFCRCATSPTKPNCGYDLAGAASSFALFIAVFHAMTHVCDGK